LKKDSEILKKTKFFCLYKVKE